MLILDRNHVINATKKTPTKKHTVFIKILKLYNFQMCFLVKRQNKTRRRPRFRAKFLSPYLMLEEFSTDILVDKVERAFV